MVVSRNKRQIGTEYEKLASAFLEKQGYEILCFNYRCFFGEIDIIVKDDDTLVFCEVKHRSSDTLGNPLEAVGVKKQQIIYKCAMNYLSYEYKDEVPCRFDVIGFVGDEITHVKDAFYG
jgi:putative endonuclease